jgi:hypothetical protein
MTPMRLLLDSGAYTSWTQGVGINIDDYIAFVQRNRHLISNYVNLDVIPGAMGRMDWRSEAIEKSATGSYANLQRMKDAGLTPIPVFHQGERFHWLERLLDDREPYVGISPYMRSSQRETIRWLDQCFARLKGRPVRTHGFGVTSHILVSSFPWSSVDSTTWLQGAGNGQIVVPVYVGSGKWDYSVRPDVISVTDGSRHNGNHIDALDPARSAFVRRYLGDVIGIDYTAVRCDVHLRWRVWIKYYKALEAIRHPTQLHFASDTCPTQGAVLNECGVHNRLISYFKLKDMSDADAVLENYVLRPPKPRNLIRQPRQWSASYNDMRKLAVLKRGAASSP